MSAPTGSLTARERQVLAMLAAGHSAGEIGRRLYISASAVTILRTGLLRKLGARNTAHAVHLGHERGLLPVGGGP